MKHARMRDDHALDAFVSALMGAFASPDAEAPRPTRITTIRWRSPLPQSGFVRQEPDGALSPLSDEDVARLRDEGLVLWLPERKEVAIA